MFGLRNRHIEIREEAGSRNGKSWRYRDSQTNSKQRKKGDIPQRREYWEVRDKKDYKRGDIRQRATFWGEKYWEIRNNSGTRTGDIRQRREFWGREYWEVRDKKPQKGLYLPPGTAKYSGRLSFPKKVYEGDSQNVSLILDEQSFVAGLHPEIFDAEDKVNGQKHVSLQISKNDAVEQFLEVELLAAGFVAKGEEKQQQSLALAKLEYRWNCHFKSAGNHTFSLVLKVINPSCERTIRSIEQTIKVVKFGHATQRQVQLAVLLAGAAGLVATLLTILNYILWLLGIPHR